MARLPVLHFLQMDPVTDHVVKLILDRQAAECFDRLDQLCVAVNNGRKLTCVGDEPYNPDCEQYVRGSDWLLHEAFCLYAERDIWKPYEKHHSTVKDACELAESLGIPNLVLWHTEDSNVAGRERLYKSEGKRYYSGNIYVPDDESLIAL